MRMLDDEFIETVITPETETTNPTETMEIYREFDGLEAVAQFDEEDVSENGGESDD